MSCEYIFIKGRNKGKMCGAKPKLPETKFCATHKKIMHDRDVASDPRWQGLTQAEADIEFWDIQDDIAREIMDEPEFLQEFFL